MDFKKLSQKGSNGRVLFMNAIWLLSLGYFIVMSFNLFLAPEKFSIPVQIKKIEANQIEVKKSNPYELKINRGKFKLCLVEDISDVPNIFYYNAILYLLHLATFVYIAYQAKKLTYNIFENQHFDISNIKGLRNIGRAFAIIGILYPILQRKITSSAISNILFPNVELSAQFENNWMYYTIGILLVIIASAFEKGFELQKEQALTI